MRRVLLCSFLFSVLNLSARTIDLNANVNSNLEKQIADLKKEINELKEAQKQFNFEQKDNLKNNNSFSIEDRVSKLEEKNALRDKLKISGQVKAVALLDTREIGSGFNRDYSYSVLVKYKDDPEAQYGNELRSHIKETRLVFEYDDNVNLFSSSTPIKLFMDFDLYNGKEGSGLFTHSYQPRVRNAYVGIGNLKIGLLWTLFMDLENFPQLVDFGNSTGEALLRQPAIMYHYHVNDCYTLSASIENPDSAYIRLDGTKTYSETLGGSGNRYSRRSMPDFIVALRYRRDGINLGARAVLTSAKSYEEENVLGEKHGTALDRAKAIGGGIGLSGGYTFSNNDKIIAHLNLGDGMGRYLHDAADSGFYFDKDDKKMYRHRVIGGLIGYRHNWTKHLRSNINFGLTKIKLDRKILNQNENDKRKYKFFDHLTTLHANIIWNPVEKIEFGFEYLRITKFQAKFKNIARPSEKGKTSRFIASVKISF